MPDIFFNSNSGASPGYLAMPADLPAPDLYRREPTTQPDEAQQRMMALSMENAEKDMRGGAAHLISLRGASGERVGAVGFCLGGGLAVWAAAASPLIGATVSYYYVMPHGKPDFTNITGPVLGHFGTADEFVSPEEARALETELRDAGVDTTFEFYEGAGHAFFNDTNRLGTYEPELAARSWERTIGFLREQLAAAKV